ncbi:hypothetical protein ABZ953_06820 [Streptomyces sp. NPDC046465]|uniref:hypothetical protein n=1 Tax=Streptomyces sp. NPDC046465 TaxID=3155810 RepID=UPI0033C0C98F
MTSPLPQRYQRYAAPAGQRPVYPAAVELHGEREAVVWVPSAERPGEMVAIPKSYYVQPEPAGPPRDLTPQPLLDRQAQRMVGGGIGAGAAGAGVGWGFGQAAAGIATFGGSSAALVLLLLLLAARIGGRRSGDTITVYNHTSWWGRSSTRI